MERGWNVDGTHLGTRSGRVPNAFSVRLFLSSTVFSRGPGEVPVIKSVSLQPPAYICMV